MRSFPVAGFKPAPVDLFEVLHALPEVEMCKALGVGQWQFRGWLDGSEPVPLIAYKFAQVIAGRTLPASFGPFAGMRYEGGQLLLANRVGKRAGIAYAELSSLEGMRDAIKAANTLEAENRRLRKACDFYKAQCFRDARYGMVVNELFDY